MAAKALADLYAPQGLTAFGRIGNMRASDGKSVTDVLNLASSRQRSLWALLDIAGAEPDRKCVAPALDGWFGEEAARNTRDTGRAHLAAIQRGAPDVSLLDQAKGSLTTKLKPPCWSDEFTLKLTIQLR